MRVQDLAVFPEFKVMDQRKEERRAEDRLAKTIADLEEISKALTIAPRETGLAAFNEEFLEIIEASNRRRIQDRRRGRHE